MSKKKNSLKICVFENVHYAIGNIESKKDIMTGLP